MSLPAETADLFAAAKAEGCESVLDSFCDEYIRAFVRQSLEDGMSFRDMVRKMKRAVDVYEEIHKLEDRMDKNLFVRLVKGGYCTFGKGRCSPLSPMDNSSTMFLQAAKLQKGFWEIDSSSPEGAAIIRACLWQYEILMSRNATTPEEACIIVHDEIGRSPLDINFGIKGTCIGMLYSISLVRNERIYMVGVSALQSLTLSMVKKFVPGGRLDRLQVLSTREELIGILCRDEIPDFWMTAGSHPCPNDRNDIWQYERCLHNTNRITLKDVLNPDPWPFEKGECCLAEVRTSVSPVKPLGFLNGILDGRGIQVGPGWHLRECSDKKELDKRLSEIKEEVSESEFDF